MKFYKNKWFWALIFFVVLSVSWNTYTSLAKNKNASQNDVKPKANDQQISQVAQNNMLPDTRLLMEEESKNQSPQNSDSNQSIKDKLNKVKTLQDLQNKKIFMLIMAQDDLEHYTWGEKSEFPDIWRQAYLRYNINGNQIMLALQYDVDTYLTYGSSDYSLVWAMADLSYETYKNGKLKSSMSAQAYQNLEDNLNAVNSRLGIIYGNREYTKQYYGQSQPDPQSQSQIQQAPD